MNLDRFGPVIKAVLSTLIVLGFFALIATLVWLAFRDKDFPPGIKETLLILVGILAGEFKNTCGYWIGTSWSSSRKTELMASTGETK